MGMIENSWNEEFKKHPIKSLIFPAFSPFLGPTFTNYETRGLGHVQLVGARVGTLASALLSWEDLSEGSLSKWLDVGMDQYL